MHLGTVLLSTHVPNTLISKPSAQAKQMVACGSQSLQLLGHDNAKANSRKIAMTLIIASQIFLLFIFMIRPTI